MFSLQTLASVQGFRTIGQGIARLHARFPLTLLCSLAGTCFGLYLLEYERDHDLRPFAVRLIFTFLLGVPLLFSAEMYGERQPKHRWYAVLGVLIFLVLYFYTNPFHTNLFDSPVFYIRTIALLAIGHLCVSFMPYLNGQSNDAFWQYNKTLFLAIFTAFLYSATLAAGLMLALGAINHLFDLHVGGWRYAQVFICINGYINTLLFLSNLKSLPEIDTENQYPKGLKYFTQYVLLPLVGIYVLILLAYETKIIATWSLPRGWVSNLVLASGVFGILAFLLVYPLKNLHAWIAKLTRSYYLILLPLVALMMVAVYTRINNYGITEPRFLVAILAVWLLGVALYFGVLGKTNIKIIPISLALILLVSIYGPLSCFEVSARNQVNRLKQALTANGLLDKNGKITPLTTQKLSPDDTRKIDAAFDYLAKYNVEMLQPFFQKADYEKISKAERWEKRGMITDVTKIKGEGFGRVGDNNYRYIGTENAVFFNISKADYLIELYSRTEETFKADGYDFVLKQDKSKITININKESLVLDLQPFTKIRQDRVSVQDLTTQVENERWKVTVILHQIVVSENDTIESYTGKLLITKK